MAEQRKRRPEGHLVSATVDDTTFARVKVTAMVEGVPVSELVRRSVRREVDRLGVEITTAAQRRKSTA
jgi:hypothetical protein